MKETDKTEDIICDNCKSDEVDGYGYCKHCGHDVYPEEQQSEKGVEALQFLQKEFPKIYRGLDTVHFYRPAIAEVMESYALSKVKENNQHTAMYFEQLFLLVPDESPLKHSSSYKAILRLIQSK